MYLNCHTYYSFKFGTMSTEQLLHEAKLKGCTQLALTDINNTSAVLDFVRLAPSYGIKPVVGIDFRNGATQKFIGIAKNNDGFDELNRFLTAHLTHNQSFDERAPVFENAYIIYPYQYLHSCKEATNEANLKSTFAKIKDLASHEFIGIHARQLFSLQQEMKDFQPDEWQKKIVLLSPVTFRSKMDFNAHRLLRAIDNNLLLSKLPITEQALPDEIFYTSDELAKQYNEFPQLISNTNQLLQACNIQFEYKQNKNLRYFTGTQQGDYDLLLKLCYENLPYRYPVQNEKVRERFKKEIEVITTQGFTSYFLINWDIVRYAQSQNYFYVGRGSGANSMVAYLLRITDVDPIDLDLYFERFINPSRTSPPDFDIDFSSTERADVTDYIFYRSPYGKSRNSTVALLGTYSEMKDNSIIRELGKVFGLPKAEIDDLVDNKRNPGTPDHIVQLIRKYGEHLYSFPNHLSVHAGGILISEKPITCYTALNNPPKGFPLTQFSMLEAEDVGLYKFDILAQRGLGKIRDAVTIIQKNKQVAIDIRNVQQFKEDKAIRKNLKEARLIGCFYVESPAMRMLLTKLQAETYLDLVAASSIIRPGVASSGMMREYILRSRGMKPSYQTPQAINDILHDTYGVMVYQEDVIKVAYHFAGLSFADADMLRRGMSGKYRGREEFKKVEQKFFNNCKQKGYPDTTTKEVWRQIESFAGYAFSKGHSASYAVESYQCMFLKTHFPLEYMVAVINNGGGFYRPEIYFHEARLCGAMIHAPHINQSEAKTIIKGKVIYIGFDHLAEFETNVITQLINERKEHGVFSSLQNFMSRVDISVEQLRILIRVGAFEFTGRSKKQLLWDIHTQIGAQKKTQTRHELFEVEQREFTLPPLFHHSLDDAWDQIEILGFPLCSPFDLIKEVADTNTKGNENQWSTTLTTLSLATEFKEHLGNIVRIVGYLVTRKRTRTKRGDEMCFGTFLDKAGNWIDTTHFPLIMKQFPFTGNGCYLLTGKVVEEFGFYSLDISEMKRIEYKVRSDSTVEQLS